MLEAEVRLSHKDLLKVKDLGSFWAVDPAEVAWLPLICSRDAQLDCLSITDEPDGGEDTSEAEAVEVIEDLGIGFGGEVVARDTLSRGLAPLDGKVRLKEV